MKAQAEQLAKMSETLESSGFSRPQSNAVIESVALAMETFAVTPELLDDRFGKLDDRFGKVDDRFRKVDERFSKVDDRFSKLENRIDTLREEMHALFAAQREEMMALLAVQAGDIKDLRQSVDTLKQTMFDFQQSVMRYMMVFTLLLLGAVVGLFGTILGQIYL